MRFRNRGPQKIHFEAVGVVTQPILLQRLDDFDIERIGSSEVEFLGVRRDRLQVMPVEIEAVPRMGSRAVPQDRSAHHQLHVWAEEVIDHAVDGSLGNREGKPAAFVPVGTVVAHLAKSIDLGGLAHGNSWCRRCR
jgi:hypothetical protein